MDKSNYCRVEELNSEHGIYLVKNKITGKICVQKILDVYNKSVFEYIKTHPIDGIPKILELFEENGFLFVIEEYIPGKTIKEILDMEGSFLEQAIIFHVKRLCITLNKLHSLNPSIIHRDIKPSNVIISDRNETVLIDLDAAKITVPGQNKDTQLIGTEGYAAPEQYGFGASSTQTDIFGLGQLMHVMITNDLDTPVPDESFLKPIVDKCLELNPKDRYSSVMDLYSALNNDHHKISRKNIAIISVCIIVLLFLLFLIMNIDKGIGDTNLDLTINVDGAANHKDIPDSLYKLDADSVEDISDTSSNLDILTDNEEQDEKFNIHSPIGVYSGDYGEILLINTDGLAYYYCNSVEFTELACPWLYEDNSISIDFSKMHCTVTASVKSDNFSRLTFKSKSSNWNTEVFNKISDDCNKYYLSPPPSNSSVISVMENGEMQFYIGDIQFTIPKNFIDYGDEYQSHDIKMFTDNDATYDYVACSLFYEDNVNSNPNLANNCETLLYDFCCRFLSKTSLTSLQESSIAGKKAYRCMVTGKLNDGFIALSGDNIYGMVYILYDEDSSELIYVLQFQKENTNIDDSELFDYIINEARAID